MSTQNNPLQSSQQMPSAQVQQLQRRAPQGNGVSHGRFDPDVMIYFYIYDTLKQNNIIESARALLPYLREHDPYQFLSKKNEGSSGADNGSDLPNVQLPYDAPQSFLYEWFTMLWEELALKKQNGTSIASGMHIPNEVRTWEKKGKA